jgi:hypothetical protein
VLRSERREWLGTDYWANLVRAGNLRMPPPATSALLLSCPSSAPGSAETLPGHLNSHRTNLRSEERIKFYEFCPTRTNGGNYSYLSATIGSTRMARRAGR